MAMGLVFLGLWWDIRKCYGKPVGAYNELGSGGALEIKIDIQNDTHIYICRVFFFNWYPP